MCASRPPQPRAASPATVPPFRLRGYPWVPLFFVAAALFAVVSAVLSGPRNAGLGALIIAAGVPAFWWWRRAAGRGAHGGAAT